MLKYPKMSNILFHPIKGNAKIHGIKSLVGTYDGDEVTTLPFHLIICKKYINIVDRKKHFTIYDGGVNGKNAIFRKRKETNNIGIWLEHHNYVKIKERGC